LGLFLWQFVAARSRRAFGYATLKPEISWAEM